PGVGSGDVVGKLDDPYPGQRQHGPSSDKTVSRRWAGLPSHCPEHKAPPRSDTPQDAQDGPRRPPVPAPPPPPTPPPPPDPRRPPSRAPPLGRRPAPWAAQPYGWEVRRDLDEARCLSGGNARCETAPGNAGARPFEPLHPLALLELGGRDRPRQRLVQRL